MTDYPTAGRRVLVLLALGLLQACSEQFDPGHQDADTGRWFTQTQVDQGEQVYQSYCASCHGTKAEATPQWIKPDADGRYPPPPLNGTAHAWHHPFPVLKKTINEGVAGRMPAWQDTLSDADVDAVIAWFQSLWPDEGYQIWQRRHK
ncbi:MAG: mono/diheme cytochrome c family protein [Motiliproteus sp.]|jgi:mono/diheme cytochrome c family protein